MTEKEIKALQFKNFQANSNAPAITCSACGKVKTPAPDWRFTEIEIAPDADYTIVVCSYACEQDFKHHPMAEQYVTDNINRMKKMHG